MPKALSAYNAKRNFRATAEPRGVRAKTAKRLRFVVQKHDASRLHYDFRLEAAGVLASWAVPKGPTLVPGERRLAMHVEDHPIAYRDFEGIIPKGEYGAGEVIVWDTGWYALADGSDPAAQIADGKIKFILHGKKLRGLFTLVRMKRKEGESGDPWLLLKDHDGKDPKTYDITAYPKSVLSGKTLEDIRAQTHPKLWHSNRPGAALPAIASVMLATPIEKPFDDDDWLFEIKWDGYRALCTIDAKRRLTLVSRNGKDLLAQFPDLAALGQAFREVPIIVDGEIVSLDERGRSNFQRLQESAQAGSTLTYAAFDLLYAEGSDQRKHPIEERKALLEKLIRIDRGALYSKHIIGSGVALFAQAQLQHLEGIVGKRRGSFYQERRSRDWVKIKAQCESEFVIGGWTEPRGNRAAFGSLLLGAYVGSKLYCVGHVGTGFTAKSLAAIATQLKALERKTTPFANDVDANEIAHWVSPKLVAQVRFTEWTRDGNLRHPAFLGLRIDKAARDVTLERPNLLEHP